MNQHILSALQWLGVLVALQIVVICGFGAYFVWRAEQQAERIEQAEEAFERFGEMFTK